MAGISCADGLSAKGLQQAEGRQTRGVQPRQELLAHLQAWCFDPPGSTWSFPQKLARDRWKHDPGLGPLGRDLEAMGLVVREWPRPMAGVPAALAGGPNGLPASV